MIHDPEYVKELIKKQVEGTLTPVEAERLKGARKIYDDGEFLRMAGEVLTALEGKLSEDPLKEWKPDFEAIRSGACRSYGKGNGRLMVSLRLGGIAAAAVLLVMLIAYLGRDRQPDFYLSAGECGDVPPDKEIPASEFACTVRWGDSSGRRVGSKDSGQIIRLGQIAVIKDSEGIIKLMQSPNAPAADTGILDISVVTGSRQQCIVELPDGVRIRLNAGSKLHFPLSHADGEPQRVKLMGEAYVKVPLRDGRVRSVMETFNSLIECGNGDFSVMAVKGYTRTVLMGGKLSLRSRTEKRQLELDCYGALGIVASYRRMATTVPTDSLTYSPHGNPDRELTWTKAVRTYRDVPLRQFVAEASRWQGFRVENIYCIPADVRISISVCYKAPVNEVLAAIQEEGVTMYEREGMVSFCRPKKENHAALAEVSSRAKIACCTVRKDDRRGYNR
ncbi:FecR domain-containing protein [Olivibacter sp. 47]|uniref:FecR protein n=1 Tax=Sphingobacterium sp. (strain 21) TaxID=743722 RepID=F4CF44_SPHS2|nr:FecR domain-containing protein [Olivibacter sp. 47]MDM8174110.1 FecR domain-containing protein [Olivibacter sp. 47]